MDEIAQEVLPKESEVSIAQNNSSEEKNSDQEMFVLDDYGNPNLHRGQSEEPRTESAEHSRIVAKYKWRASSVFSEVEDSGSSDSDDDFDEEFHKILTASKLCTINEGEEMSQTIKTKTPKNKIEYPKLDKDYYELPELSNLSLTCMMSLELEPFGTVVQHYDSLVLIKSIEGLPFLDMDTMLFTEDHKPVGRIYELIGVLENPFYNILYPNSKIAEEMLPLNTKICYAPRAPPDITKFLILSELEKNYPHPNHDDGEGDDEEEDTAETEYYNRLRRELQEYESKKKRQRNSSVSSTHSMAPSRKRNPFAFQNYY